MRNLFAFSFLLLSFFIGKAQNLVPNGSFEEMVSCPNDIDQIGYATGWSGFSTEYFNACDTIGSFLAYYSVPENVLGYQNAASGNGYAGLIPYIDTINPYREFIQNTLTAILTPGTRYFLSFKVSLSDYNLCATNNIGILLSTFPFAIDNSALIYNHAQLFSPTIISDTANWTFLSGSFIADSAYQYVIVGNFFDNVHTSSFNFNQPISYSSYYYIDDVCVSTDSMLCNTSVGIQEPKQNEAVNIYPNPFTNQISLEVSNAEEVTVHLSDMLGRQVLLATFSASATISTASLVRGVYFYTVENEKGIMKKGKVVKE